MNNQNRVSLSGFSEGLGFGRISYRNTFEPPRSPRQTEYSDSLTENHATFLGANSDEEIRVRKGLFRAPTFRAIDHPAFPTWYNSISFKFHLRNNNNTGAGGPLRFCLFCKLSSTTHEDFYYNCTNRFRVVCNKNWIIHPRLRKGKHETKQNLTQQT